MAHFRNAVRACSIAVLSSGAIGTQALAQSAAAQISATHALLPRDLSPWGMFLAADAIVKAVMIGLAFASLVTWTVWIAKTLELLRARQAAMAGVKALAGIQALADAPYLDGAVGRLVAAAQAEVAGSSGLSAEGIKERLAVALSRIEAQSARAMQRGTGLLATIGATAPFVGLFGTVWGIMNSFIGISRSNTTSLAVVAPGIAEALLATALGLVAAIPAVVIYNAFSRAIAGQRAALADASALVVQLVSRDLDRAANKPPVLRAAAE